MVNNLTHKEIFEVSKRNRIGETATNKYGTEFKIIDYLSSHQVLIETTDSHKYQKWVYYRDFKRGALLSPFDKTVRNVGYLGAGKWNACENGVKTSSYIAWQGMINRCYDYKFQEKRPKYKECEVVEEWHNYQNFAQWWDNNYYNCGYERMCLDKDILIKNNTIYSENTCLIVPNTINTLIENCTSSRGNLPLGVSFDKATNLYRSTSREIINGKSQKIVIGFYNSPYEAFMAYKNWKEKYIKKIADQYKMLIPDKVYNALCEYKIEITD